MSFTLFPDQNKFVGELAISLHRYDSIIGCAATGYGKSKVFITIADRYHAQKPENVVLIVTESIKIYNQISFEMKGRIFEINAQSGKTWIPDNSICVAMAQTLMRREELLKRFRSFGKNLLIIIDECHVGTFNKILAELVEAKKIGFSATPDARWAKHLPQFYRSIVVGPQPEELVRLGRLTPYKHFARVSADLSTLSVKAGEFSEESQEIAFSTSQVFDGLAQDLRSLSYRKSLIFCSSIKDCEFEHKRLVSHGFNCVRVHSEMPDSEESYSLGQFMKHDVNICVSVGTLTKGFDFPAIDLVILRRATTSLPLYLQMCGRGSRKYPGKDIWTVLDYGQNFLRFGLWDMDREWENLWDKPNKPREGVAPVKLCPRCEYIMPSGASICPNCGFEFIKPQKDLEQGKLIEVTEQFTLACVGKRFSQLTPEELAIYANFKAKKSYAARIAKALDKQRPNEKYLERYGAAMGYKATWVDWCRRTMQENGDELNFYDFVIR